MPRVRANGIELEYDRSGTAGGGALLLIHGVGAQLIRWPQAFVDALGAAGFDVVRFDNRDIGLSTHMTGAEVPDPAAVAAARARGETPALPYTLADLAADAAGLLDALGIAAAHVVGVSLGGMIAQLLAIERPARVLSLAIVMSTGGDPAGPRADPAATAALAARPPDPRDDFEGYLAHAVALNRTLGGPAYPTEETTLRDFAAAAAARAHHPAGAARQLAAARGAADRRAGLRGLSVPTLVIHGADDPLIPAAAGADIAAHVDRAWLLTIAGMGHDLPAPLFDLFVATIAANARRADVRGG